MKSSELLRKVKKAGWLVDRQSGSHVILIHPDKPGIILVVPNHGNSEVPTGTEKSILKKAGLK